MTESSSPYLHGFSPVEQARLIKQARLLEREIRDAIESGIGRQHADQRIHITERMKLDHRKDSMSESQHEHRYAEMAAVVQQWEEPGIQSAQRSDR